MTRSNGARVQALRRTPPPCSPIDERALADDDAGARLVLGPQPGERQALPVPDLDRRSGSPRPTSIRSRSSWRR